MTTEAKPMNEAEVGGGLRAIAGFIDTMKGFPQVKETALRIASVVESAKATVRECERAKSALEAEIVAFRQQRNEAKAEAEREEAKLVVARQSRAEVEEQRAKAEREYRTLEAQMSKLRQEARRFSGVVD